MVYYMAGGKRWLYASLGRGFMTQLDLQMW